MRVLAYPIHHTLTRPPLTFQSQPVPHTMGRLSSRGSSCHHQHGSPPSNRPSTTSTSISELSQYLDRHTISGQSQSDAVPIRTRILHHPSDSDPSFHRLVSSPRQKTLRRQFSGVHFARIASVVEDVGRDDQSVCDASSTSSFSDVTTSPSLSPDESSAARSSYFQLASQPSPVATAETGSRGSTHHAYGPEVYKMNKDLRHSASKDSIGGHQKIHKSIRMRKRVRDMSVTAEKMARR